jgi:hypothetical protein
VDVTGGEIAQCATPVLLAGIGWMFRNSLGRITDRIKRLEVRTGEAETGIEGKASREDFIREMSRTRTTLEKLVEGQGRLEGKMDTGTRIAAAIEALAEQKGQGDDISG